MIENPSISVFGFGTGRCEAIYADGFCRAFSLSNNKVVVSGEYWPPHLELRDSSAFIYVQRGSLWLNEVYPLSAGMYAYAQGCSLHLLCGTQALVVEVPGYRGLNMFGGPIEVKGRLKYIDGCSDTLLVPPVKKGDPCFNLLHFPKGITQTMHTHPSVRLGVVASGRGECITPFGVVPLVEGMVFAIKPDTGLTAKGYDGDQHPVGSHCFRTTSQEMRIVAFHPNSDWGATDEQHPMLVQTLVDGVSADKISAIHTKSL